MLALVEYAIGLCNKCMSLDDLAQEEIIVLCVVAIGNGRTPLKYVCMSIKLVTLVTQHVI